MEAAEIIKKFIRANKYQARQMMSFGFELETQETNGLNRSNLGTTDSEAYERAIAPLLDNYSSQLPSWAICPATLKQAKRMIELEHNISEESFRKPDRCELSTTTIETVTDASVRGFEHRTKKGHSYLDICRIARDVFESNNFKIDEKCSFHVHVQLKGVDHFYGKNMQILINEYIVNNQNRLSEALRERFSNRNGNISGVLDDSKSVGVRCHRVGDKQSTWEIRLFGNVTNYAEAIECFKLASEALQYAYKAKRNIRLSPLMQAIHAGMSYHVAANVVDRALDRNASTSLLLRESRLNSAIAAA